ncbi:MAG: hypothetical protein F6K55_37535 [Moorea sp. SIO4A3]|nr:hypothetical protein [Moorena sp. SIO4A3]
MIKASLSYGNFKPLAIAVPPATAVVSPTRALHQEGSREKRTKILTIHLALV